MIWNVIHHLAMYKNSFFFFLFIYQFYYYRILVRDITFFPQWSYAAKKANGINQNSTNDESKPKTHIREGLSNIQY
jgi:hypothetical protein